MPRKAPPVTDAEFRLLSILWEQSPLSARQITEALYPAPAPSKIGTVQTLLQRLEKKGLVKRDRTEHVHTFTPAVARAKYAGVQLEQMADKLTDGSLGSLVMHLVRSKRLTKDELTELRDFLKHRM